MNACNTDFPARKRHHHVSLGAKAEATLSSRTTAHRCGKITRRATGLGMTIVEALVRQLDGTLRVRTQPPWSSRSASPCNGASRRRGARRRRVTTEVSTQTRRRWNGSGGPPPPLRNGQKRRCRCCVPAKLLQNHPNTPDADDHEQRQRLAEQIEHNLGFFRASDCIIGALPLKTHITEFRRNGPNSANDALQWRSAGLECSPLISFCHVSEKPGRVRCDQICRRECGEVARGRGWLCRRSRGLWTGNSGR
jgi:hypothetical protein